MHLYFISMATANPVRTLSRLSSDRSGSFSDDVVSLDSWSEKLDNSVSRDWSSESENRPRLSSASSAGRSGLSHQCKNMRQPHPDHVRKQKSVLLRSAESNSNPRDKPPAISTISGTVHSLDQHRHRPQVSSSRRRSSSTSSDSESSPLPSPRNSLNDTNPHSPNRQNPASGSHYCVGGKLQFAHHLRPHYQSSPILRGVMGPPADLAPRPYHPPHPSSPSHQQQRHPDHSSPRRNPHSGVLYFGNQRPHHNTYYPASNAPIEQVLEREGEKLKTKMKSMWNNMKYGWTLKTKTSFKYDSPIFLLGRCYHRRFEVQDFVESPPQSTESLDHHHPHQQHHHQHHHHHQQQRVSALDEFHADFTSRLWFTYRREFSPIGSARMTTDCGWGCMLRSGQMMMAQGLVQHFLGRDWKVYSEQKREDLAFYREIIRWFGDQASDKVPFALHRLVELGTSVGKMPGEWYGPASVAHILRDAVDKAHISLPILSNISVYVAQDCTIYLQDLKKILTSHARSSSFVSNSSVSESDPHPPPSSSSASSSHTEEKFRSVIILVPMRLGGETLNEIYVPCVKSMLAHDHCIGIIGGRPKHSLYFVGWQDDKLIYLDPHYCQDTVDTTQTTYPIQSYHCMSPRKMVFSKMDPSCTVGFYCKDRDDLLTFLDQIPDLVVPPKQKGQYPLFVVSEGSSEDAHARGAPVREIGRLRIRHMHTDRAGNRVRSPTVDSEDFVIL